MHFGGKSRALPPIPLAQAPAEPLGSCAAVAIHRNRTAFNLSCSSARRRCVLQQSLVVQHLVVVLVCSSHSCSPAHICPHHLLLQANTIRPTRCKPQRECLRGQIDAVVAAVGTGLIANCTRRCRLHVLPAGFRTASAPATLTTLRTAWCWQTSPPLLMAAAPPTALDFASRSASMPQTTAATRTFTKWSCLSVSH